nr:zinc finger, CCHC-type [Tanacetum cinerariifolium]
MTDADKTTALKTDVYKKAHSALLLCLDNKVLREVNKEDSAAVVWLKLETLYVTKSLANKLYLKKKKLFTFYMHSGKKLSEHINEFNKLIGDLANINVDIDDEDQALMLRTSLPPSYDNFVETLLYGRESLTLEDVLSSFNSRELKKRTDANDDGDGLYVRGRSNHRGNQGCGNSRSKSKGKGTYKLKCYMCYSADHLKKDCPKRHKKKSTGFVKKNAGQGSSMHSEVYDNGDLLMEVREKRFLEWIMDFGGSFHMTPKRNFLFDFKEFNGGTVLLGDNRACVIIGIGKVRVQMKDGSSFVLENARYIPELKRNLISLGTLDREGYTMKLQNERVKVIKGSLMVLSRTMKGNYVYSLDSWAESGEASVGIQEKESLAQVWHKRPSHISEAGLHELEKREQVEGVEAVGGKPDRSPSTALEKKTPMDLWSGYMANYEMLRIFGCVAYSHVNQGKLKPRAIKCIFLRVEPTMNRHTGENPGNEDEEQDEELQQHNLENYVLVRDRAKRTTYIPAGIGMKEEDTHEPITFQEAINSSDKDVWVRAMVEDMSSLMKNHTWELVDQPPGQKLVSCKWLYKIKKGIEGVQKPRYKARLVAWGFTQQAGIDYNEVFSPVVRHTSIRVILSLTACEDYELEQLDVKTVFLHGNLEETVYMRQPPSFEERTGNKSEFENTKRLLRKEFDMKELGPARKILGMEIVRDRGNRTLKVSQSGYVQKILNNYIVDNGKSVSVPLGAYFKVSLKDCPSNDWDVERMSKVLYANVVGLMYGRNQGKHVDVDGFVDADYAKDPDKGRSIIGYVFMIHGCIVSWNATLQHVVALSTTEAEYMALTEAVKKHLA